MPPTARSLHLSTEQPPPPTLVGKDAVSLESTVPRSQSRAPSGNKYSARTGEGGGQRKETGVVVTSIPTTGRFVSKNQDPLGVGWDWVPGGFATKPPAGLCQEVGTGEAGGGVCGPGRLQPCGGAVGCGAGGFSDREMFLGPQEEVYGR